MNSKVWVWEVGDVRASVGFRSRVLNANTLVYNNTRLLFSLTFDLFLLFSCRNNFSQNNTYLWWWWYFKCSNSSSSIHIWNIFVFHFELEQKLKYDTVPHTMRYCLNGKECDYHLKFISKHLLKHVYFDIEQWIIYDGCIFKAVMAIIINVFVIRGWIAETHIFSFHFFLSSFKRVRKNNNPISTAGFFLGIKFEQFKRMWHVVVVAAIATSIEPNR